MNATLHVYTVGHQPATNFVTDGIRIRNRRRSLVWCECCRRPRWAGNCTVQAYYDGPRFRCRKGKGCR